MSYQETNILNNVFNAVTPRKDGPCSKDGSEESKEVEESEVPGSKIYAALS